MENQKRNLNISGSGSYPGGEFDKVSISGSGKITGDLRCEKFSTSGSSKVEGNIVCDTLNINGSSKITGNVSGRSVTINGSCKIEGNIQGEKVKICGSATVGGAIKVANLGIYGSAKIHEDIEAEEVHIMGGIQHEKFINAERVIIDSRNSGGFMSFNEIGASSVIINQATEEKLWQKFIGLFNGRTGRIVGNCIEADTIKIEGANIQILRGENIEIGQDCQVDLVEYTGTFTVHGTSKVNQVKQIEK